MAAESLNIVDLIENQPISRLTDTYNVKLLQKVKETFTNSEQQLFIGSFYCYLNYNERTDFVVDLDLVWKWLGFNQKYNAIVVLEKNFTVNVDYTSLLLKVQEQTSEYEKPSGRGGHNIKKISLTIHCFKSLCLKAQTKKAKEVHEYYLKLETLLYEVLQEESAELKQRLTTTAAALEQKTEELKRTPEQATHNTLLRKYGVIQGALVYIVRVKQYDDGRYIIKIGESRRGIRGRWNEFKTKYGPQVLIMDCFLVQNSAGLEKYLHSHPEIHPAKVSTLEGHEQENELFLIGGSLAYQRVTEIVEAALPQFNDLTTEYEQLKRENERLKQESPALVTIPSDVLRDLLHTQQQVLHAVQRLEIAHQEVLARVNSLQTRTMMPACSLPDPHLGPRLQKIHPETMQLLRVYETVTECMKEDPSMKRPSINKAARENTIYRGYRWCLVDRDQDASQLNHVPPTKATRPQKNGYIAKLDREQTEILAVYLDRKTAAQQNHYPSIASLDQAVKHRSLKDGHYYVLYEECDEELKHAFVATKGQVTLYHDGVGQFTTDHRLITEFVSRFDCTTRTGMSQKTLAKVLNQPVLYKEHYYNTLGTKVFM